MCKSRYKYGIPDGASNLAQWHIVKLDTDSVKSTPKGCIKGPAALPQQSG